MAPMTAFQILQGIETLPLRMQRHVENILDKLGFGSRAQVAAWAVGEGLVASTTTGYGPVSPSPT